MRKAQRKVKLFSDTSGEFTLEDLVRTAATYTADPKRQRAIVNAYLHGAQQRESMKGRNHAK